MHKVKSIKYYVDDKDKTFEGKIVIKDNWFEGLVLNQGIQKYIFGVYIDDENLEFFELSYNCSELPIEHKGSKVELKDIKEDYTLFDDIYFYKKSPNFNKNFYNNVMYEKDLIIESLLGENNYYSDYSCFNEVKTDNEISTLQIVDLGFTDANPSYGIELDNKTIISNIEFNPIELIYNNLKQYFIELAYVKNNGELLKITFNSRDKKRVEVETKKVLINEFGYSSLELQEIIKTIIVKELVKKENIK